MQEEQPNDDRDHEASRVNDSPAKGGERDSHRLPPVIFVASLSPKCARCAGRSYRPSAGTVCQKGGTCYPSARPPFRVQWRIRMRGSTIPMVEQKTMITQRWQKIVRLSIVTSVCVMLAMSTTAARAAHSPPPVLTQNVAAKPASYQADLPPTIFGDALKKQKVIAIPHIQCRHVSSQI